MPKKGNAYLAGTVHVGKEVQTKMHIWLEPYMWEKRYKPKSGTVHVAKCSSYSVQHDWAWALPSLSDVITLKLVS